MTYRGDEETQTDGHHFSFIIENEKTDRWTSFQLYNYYSRYTITYKHVITTVMTEAYFLSNSQAQLSETSHIIHMLMCVCSYVSRDMYVSMCCVTQ